MLSQSIAPPARALAFALPLALAAMLGCAGTPTPLAPSVTGSVGVPHHGVLTDARLLPRQGEGYRLLRDNGVSWGHPRLVAAIEHAAGEVARQRPGGARLLVGDLSNRFGGEAVGHRSHRTGRDVDLLLYSLTPSGEPVETPGFVRFGPDGLAQGNGAGATTFVRLDLERQWLFIKSLMGAPSANVQWLFVARWLEALVVEYALARGEDPELVWQAETMMLQPSNSAAHDDHIHVRIACTPEEAVSGCMGGGPRWPWLEPLPEVAQAADDELAEAIAPDLRTGAAPPVAAPVP